MGGDGLADDAILPAFLWAYWPPLLYQHRMTPDVSRRTLKGIKGVYVLAAVAKDIEDAGLRTDVIKTDTELKLRQAGIRVLETDAEFTSTPGSPGLDVSVEGLSNKEVYGYSVSVSLSQNVLLERDPSLRATGKYRGIPFRADTWNTAVGGLQLGNPSDHIRSNGQGHG